MINSHHNVDSLKKMLEEISSKYEGIFEELDRREGSFSQETCDQYVHDLQVRMAEVGTNIGEYQTIHHDAKHLLGRCEEYVRMRAKELQETGKPLYDLIKTNSVFLGNEEKKSLEEAMQSLTRKINDAFMLQEAEEAKETLERIHESVMDVNASQWLLGKVGEYWNLQSQLSSYKQDGMFVSNEIEELDEINGRLGINAVTAMAESVRLTSYSVMDIDYRKRKKCMALDQNMRELEKKFAYLVKRKIHSRIEEYKKLETFLRERQPRQPLLKEQLDKNKLLVKKSEELLEEIGKIDGVCYDDEHFYQRIKEASYGLKDAIVNVAPALIRYGMNLTKTLQDYKQDIVRYMQESGAVDDLEKLSTLFQHIEKGKKVIDRVKNKSNDTFVQHCEETVKMLYSLSEVFNRMKKMDYQESLSSLIMIGKKHKGILSREELEELEKYERSERLIEKCGRISQEQIYLIRTAIESGAKKVGQFVSKNEKVQEQYKLFVKGLGYLERLGTREYLFDIKSQQEERQTAYEQSSYLRYQKKNMVVKNISELRKQCQELLEHSENKRKLSPKKLVMYADVDAIMEKIKGCSDSIRDYISADLSKMHREAIVIEETLEYVSKSHHVASKEHCMSITCELKQAIEKYQKNPLGLKDDEYQKLKNIMGKAYRASYNATVDALSDQGIIDTDERKCRVVCLKSSENNPLLYLVVEDLEKGIMYSLERNSWKRETIPPRKLDKLIREKRLDPEEISYKTFKNYGLYMYHKPENKKDKLVLHYINGATADNKNGVTYIDKEKNIVLYTGLPSYKFVRLDRDQIGDAVSSDDLDPSKIAFYMESK